MKINVNAVLQREIERKGEVKPLPKVKVLSDRQQISTIRKPEAPIRKESDRDFLLRDLWTEITKIKKERAKLSSKTAKLVDDTTEKLRREGAGVVKAFLGGDIPVPAIKQHYEKIQAFTEQAKVVWDKIRYVEQYGKLPEERLTVNIDTSESQDIKALHYEIRRLDDLIHKSNKKLDNAKTGIKKPKNSANLEKWKLKIELATAKRTDLKQKLKSLQYDAREQRTSAE